jgi:hypothetical protein
MNQKLKDALKAVADAVAELPVEEMGKFQALGMWLINQQFEERHPVKWLELNAWREAQKHANRSEAARRAAQTRAKQR